MPWFTVSDIATCLDMHLLNKRIMKTNVLFFLVIFLFSVSINSSHAQSDYVDFSISSGIQTSLAVSYVHTWQLNLGKNKRWKGCNCHF